MTATAHDTAKIWGFATHELEVGDARLLEDHLVDCPECREELLLVRSVRALAGRAAQAIPVLDWGRIDAAVGELVESGTARTAGLAVASRRWHSFLVPMAVLGVAAAALAAHGVPPSQPPASEPAAALLPLAPDDAPIPMVLEAQACTRGKDALKAGAPLSAGDVLKTGKGFALVRLPDGTRLRLGENASLKLLRISDDGASASLERGRVAVQAEKPVEVSSGAFKARGVAGVFSVNSKTTGVEIASAKGRVHVERPGLLPMLVDTGRKAAFTWKTSAAKMATVNAADQAEFDKVILAPSVMVAALQRSMTDTPVALTPAEAAAAAAEWSSPDAHQAPQAQPPPATPVTAAAAEPLAMQPVEAKIVEPATPIDEREFTAFPMSLPPEPARPAKAMRPASTRPVVVAVAEPPRAARVEAPPPAQRVVPEPTPVVVATSEPAPAPAPAPVEAAPVEVAQPAPAPAVVTPEMAMMREALDQKRDLRVRNGMLIAEMQPTPKDVLEAEYAKVQARRAAAEYAPLPAQAAAAPAPVAQPAPAVAAPAPAQPAMSAGESADEAEELFLLRAERSLRKGNCQTFMSGLGEIASDSPATSKTERARISRARCFQAQGKAGQAQAEYQLYLRETPSGDYASEARSALYPAAAAQPRPPSSLSDS